jgi:hypothetical protein
MMRARSALATAVLLMGATYALCAQRSDGNVRSLEGVWRIVENAAGPNDRINRNPEPSQIIYTKTHYSYLAINRPRAKARNRR